MVAHVTADDITVWLTATSAPCTSVFKPVWFDGGLPKLTAPGKQFDPQTLWWRHEVLHRATLRNYPERSAAYAKLRDDLEAEFLAGAATTEDRAGFTARCFDQAAGAEDAWLQAVSGIPVAKLPALYDRAWRTWNSQAGLS